MSNAAAPLTIAPLDVPLLDACTARLEAALETEPGVADSYMSDIHGDAPAFEDRKSVV